MQFNRTKILECLSTSLKLEPDTFFMASHCAITPKGYGQSLPWNRLTFPLTGNKHFAWSDNETINQQTLTPKQVLLIPSGSWDCEYWDCGHSMISIVFRDTCIRVLYIEHNGIDAAPNSPDYFFHTTYPVADSAMFLKLALFAAGGSKNLIFQALIQELITIIEQENDVPLEREMIYLLKIQDYIEQNLALNIGREDVASATNISSSYITLLLRKHHNIGFSGFLNLLRMNLAVNLLNNPNLEIKEIAQRCGYGYTSYFIRVFHSHFKETPQKYREKLL